MSLESLKRVMGAAGMKSAFLPKPRTQKKLIASNERDQDGFQKRLSLVQASSNTRFNARSVVLSSLPEKRAFKLTRTSTAPIWHCRCRKDSLIQRRTRLRSTARFAHRFGMAIPKRGRVSALLLNATRNGFKRKTLPSLRSIENVKTSLMR